MEGTTTTQSAAREGAYSPLIMFAAKAVIVTCLATTAVIVVLAFMSASLEATVGRLVARIEQSTKIGGAQFWSRLETELAKAAQPQSGMSPEKQKELLGHLRAITIKWKPFLSEAYTIVTEPPKTQ